MTNLKLFWKSSIFLRTLSWLLIISLLPLFIAGFISFKISEDEIKGKVIDNLQAAADSKGKMLTDFIIEKEADVKALALTPIISTALEKYNKAFFEKGTDSPEYSALDSEYIEFFTAYTEAFGYHDLFLINYAGDIVFTVVREDDFGTNLYTGDYKDTGLARAFIDAIKFDKSNVSDFKFYIPSNEPAAFIGAPIVKGDKRFGVVVFQLKNKELYSKVQNYIGLGNTGETVIASKEGHEAVFITPLRNDPDAAFKRRVTLGSNEALPIQKAVQGENGSGLSIDYRNKEILAVWKYLPHLRWGMVVKIDTDEAFDSIYNFRNRILIIGFIVFVIVLIVGYRISRAISEPIKTLRKGSERIGRGELDTVIEVESKNEIGQLAESFNKMAENLKSITASRDELDREIRERKRWESALRDSEERFRSLVAQAGDAMFLIEPGGKFIDVNQRACDVLGYTRKELLDLSVPDIDPLYPKEKLDGFIRNLKKDTPVTIEAIHKRKDGTTFPVEIRTGLINIRDNPHVLSLVRDITKRKQAEDKIKQTSLDLARSNKELERFAFIASHDLKEPLKTISGFVNLLKKRYNNKLDKNADEFIEIIVDSTKRMEQLIDNLLGYARVSMSTKKFNHTDYNKILERSISNLTVAIEDSRAKINIDPLPALMANDLQIECLFQNLISNAIKFHGKEPPIIHVSAEKKEHDWIFSVRDNGIGIEHKDTDRIFNMFQRLHSKSKYAGTGIGLSVCKNIVDNHGGRIWVESDSGKGSNFFFSIPDNQ